MAGVMADAEADAEAAFINSMQAMNNVTGSYEATGAAREHQADSVSSEEYDPAQAVQSPDAHQILSLENSKHDALPAVPVVPFMSDFTSTAQSSHNSSATKVPSHSASPSSATSSIESHPELGTLRKADGPTQVDQEHGGHVEQSSTDGHLDIDRDAAGPASSRSNSSINRVSTEDVLIQNDVQDQSASAVIQNGLPSADPHSSNVPPDVGATSFTDLAPKTTPSLPASHITEPVSLAAEQAIAPSITASRVRLPHDRVGILEDRIKDDSRGDLDAWLSLISEHRKRGKIEDARAVYERFFNVFPSSVSSSISSDVVQNLL